MIVRRIESFGGVPYPDGNDNSEAFAAAFDFFRKNGGGVLQVGKGIWKTGPLTLCSDITLELEEGAVISFIPEPELYRPVKTRWEGVVCYAMHPCILADGETNVTICGKGTIDGNGKVWWNLLAEKRKQGKPVAPIELKLAALNPGYETQPGGGGGRNTQFLRPPLIQFHECKEKSFRLINVKNIQFGDTSVKGPVNAFLNQ